MGSIAAELRLGSYTYPVLHLRVAFTQSTDQRGRPNAKVRHGQLELTMDVPADEQLFVWAAAPFKPLTGTLVTFDAEGKAAEHIAFDKGHCVLYQEFFQSGDANDGSYQCRVHITAPTGFTLGSGAGGAYVAPAARDHGAPVVLSASQSLSMAGDVSACPPDVTARLQAQVELACKAGKGRCADTDNCPTLVEKMATLQACIVARETLMNQCFGGGDAGHKQEVIQRKNGIRRCAAIYQRQCGPMPDLEPVLNPVPSPIPFPSLPKPNPAVPATLTGIALIIYLILSGLRTVPL